MQHYNPSKPTLATDMNIPDDVADKLIKQYVATPLAQYTSGVYNDLRPGHIYFGIIDQDQLTANEKGFLIAFLSQEITCHIARTFLMTDPDALGKLLHVDVGKIVWDGKEVKRS